MKNKVICLLGPTATGKTETAIALANQFPIDIISVDSAMIYRGMDIGTAKPDTATLKRYPHQLIDICDPIDRYSTVEFRNDARKAIDQSLKQNRIPLLVGGTFLYFRTLLDGISPIPATSEAIHHELLDELEKKGAIALHTNLKNVDPNSAQRLNPNDSQRIMRALAVYRMTGKTLSYYWTLPPEDSLPYPYFKFALHNHDEKSRNRSIEDRYHQMIELGLVEEVQHLIREYPQLNLDYPSLRAVGYRQIWEYLQGDHTLDKAIELAIIATRQYAKRQRTWLRREKDLIEIDIHQQSAVELIKKYI